MSHPGFVSSGTPEGGTSLTEGVVLGADSREGVAPPGLQVEREEHPPPTPPNHFQPPNLPKVVVIRAVPSCRNAVS